MMFPSSLVKVLRSPAAFAIVLEPPVNVMLALTSNV